MMTVPVESWEHPYNMQEYCSHSGLSFGFSGLSSYGLLVAVFTDVKMNSISEATVAKSTKITSK